MPALGSSALGRLSYHFNMYTEPSSVAPYTPFSVLPILPYRIPI